MTADRWRKYYQLLVSTFFDFDGEMEHNEANNGISLSLRLELEVPSSYQLQHPNKILKVQKNHWNRIEVGYDSF